MAVDIGGQELPLTLYNPLWYSAEQYFTVQYSATQQSGNQELLNYIDSIHLLYGTVQNSIVQKSVVYCTVLYGTVHYSTVDTGD